MSFAGSALRSTSAWSRWKVDYFSLLKDGILGSFTAEGAGGAEKNQLCYSLDLLSQLRYAEYLSAYSEFHGSFMIENGYFVVFAVPAAGDYYDVRAAELKAHSTVCELVIDAATLYSCLRLSGYTFHSDLVERFENIVLGRVPVAVVRALGFPAS